MKPARPPTHLGYRWLSQHSPTSRATPFPSRCCSLVHTQHLPCLSFATKANLFFENQLHYLLTTQRYTEGHLQPALPPKTTTNLKAGMGTCHKKPSRETNFHFEEESSFLPVPAVICVVQLCGTACLGSTQGSQPALFGFALRGEGKQLGIAYPWQ